MRKSATDAALTAADAQAALAEVADPDRAKNSSWFFKSGPGEYGEGDRFRGVPVPVQRKLTRTFWKMPLDELERLLQSEWHEDRLLSLLCLVRRHEKVPEEREQIHELYLENSRFVNNWDLVDSSAEYLVGPHVSPDDLTLLDRLARSESLWERRIAMLATFHFIKRGMLDPTFHVADLLLHDSEDLIHKAVGWMLREAGNRDIAREEDFLRDRYRSMPRTMLRYAIEKFPEERRKEYLRGEV